MFLSIVSPIFLKKELKNIKKLNKIIKQNTNTSKFITIWNNIIALFFLLILCQFEKLYVQKQYMLQLKQETKFLKNTSIVPLLRSKRNDIIWGVGFGCESENIDEGRSYVDKNINISDCFFSRYLTYSGDGGVIFVSGSSYFLDIKFSMFYNCLCFNQGGVMFFYSANSCLRMICANRCSCEAEANSHFAYGG